MAPRISERSRALIELPMLVFLRIADGNGKMTAREMAQFDDLLARRDWCRSELLKRALARTEAEKAELWRQYATGELRPSTERVSSTLDAVLGALDANERTSLRADITQFAYKLLQAANGRWFQPGVDVEAEKEFSILSQILARASVSAQKAATGEGAARESGAQPHVGSLLDPEIVGERPWRRGKLQVQCVQIIDETHDVKTFRFTSQPSRLFVFRPGQFITLELPIDGKVVRRSYTLSSSPSRPHTIAITVKRFEGGLASTWLHDRLGVGDKLFIDGPHGKFGCVGDPSQTFLFLSGGSGITPLMAMARWLVDTAAGVDVHFLHFARTPKDLIFEHELGLLGRSAGMKVDLVCSRGKPEDGWTGRTGRIDRELIGEICPDLASRAVYLCGPVPFMQAAQAVLNDLGFDMSRFHQESFGGLPRPSTGRDQSAGVAAKLSFSRSGRSVACQSTDYVLDVALSSGVAIPYSCRAGQCGTCRAFLLQGKVEHDCTDGLSEDDRSEGLILTCQARPQGDVTIEA